MTTLDTYRQQLTSAVESAKASFTEWPLVIEYDNRIIVDTSTQSRPFLEVSIDFMDSWQGDLNPKPFLRIVGFLTLIARVKDGAGTAEANRLLQHFYPKLQHKKHGNVNCEMAKLSNKALKRDAWCGHAVLIPFWISQPTA